MGELEELRAEVRELADQVRKLAGRVQELEDERELRELLARFAHREDGQRDEQWVDLWTGDGTYDLAAVVTNPDGTLLEVTQQVTGADGLRTLITDPNGHHRPEFYGHCLHTQGASTVVQVDGDQAVATSYTVLYQEHDGAVAVVSAASNRWTFRRVDGRWRVHERRRRQVGTEAFAENLDR